MVKCPMCPKGQSVKLYRHHPGHPQWEHVAYLCKKCGYIWKK